MRCKESLSAIWVKAEISTLLEEELGMERCGCLLSTSYALGASYAFNNLRGRKNYPHPAPHSTDEDTSVQRN